MKNILVLGSNSFSGTNFISGSLAKKAKVYGASRSIEKSSVMLPYKNSKHIKNFSFYKYDVNKNLDEIIDLINCENIQYIVNFAAQSMVGQSWDQPEDWVQTNILAISKLVSALKNNSTLKRYIHVTTPESYGSTEGWIKEGNEYYPSTPYAVSRAASDMLMEIYFKEYQFPVIFTRAANVYGPAQQLYRIIPLTIFNLLTNVPIKLDGGGKSTRSFIFMDDVSEATFLLLDQGKIGETYHISTTRIISVYDLVQLICYKLGTRIEDSVEIVEERKGKDNTYQLDSQKLRNELNWEEKFDLEKGLDITIDWFKNNLEALKNEPRKYIHKP